ncbi:MAG TPA: hypothetical protein ENK02_08055 [Planctomycetes bacterium]|nr:hypothetical protein [Planctomycetota bacterium]
MCALLLLKRPLPGFRWVVAANRDEDPQRAATPPGLHLRRGRKILAPRDKKAGGTWIGVNEKGLGAALTNLGSSSGESPFSRGLLVFDALGCSSLAEAASQARARFAQFSFQPFRLLLFQGEDCLLLESHKKELLETRCQGDLLFFTHQYAPGEAEIPGLEDWRSSLGGQEVEDLIYHLQVVLATGMGHETQGHGSFPLCHLEGKHRTVSCSMIAVPDEMPHGLRFFHSNGDPLNNELLDYSVLRKRLAGVR